MKKILAALFAVVVFYGVSFSETPIKLSLWNKIAAPNDDTVLGLELGIGSCSSNVTGVSFNFIYGKADKVVGAQIGMVNLNESSITGAQLGFFNKADFVNGAQIGFVNITDNMSGIQIGFINFIKTGKLPAMVIFNCKF
jgi:hypothetical protein